MPNSALVWTNGDTRVKVLTWTSYPSSYVPYAHTGHLVSNTWGMTWVTAVPELYAFFDDTNRAATIYTTSPPYPWTQLGYTYDWHPANTSAIGLSEYVLMQNAE